MAKAKKKKAAKKAAPKKKAKKAVAKAAPKKAASKKAAPKKAVAKAAPKKAPIKAAPKSAKPAKPAKAKPAKAAPAPETPETADAIEVETVVATPLRDEILALAKQLYGPRGDAELLAFDPNDLDAMDPSIFYEILEQKYGVSADPDNDYFGGFGGPISTTITFVESRWDGKTRNETPLPPQDWLEEATYPAEESTKN